MQDYRNPFEYEAANKFDSDQIIDYYIEDFNYSRFIRSKRNIFLVGERGTGKTMTLLFNSLPVVIKKAEREGKEPSLDIIATYIPCNTPLMHRKEYELLDKLRASIISEHYFVLNTMFAIVRSLASIKHFTKGARGHQVLSDVEYALGFKVPKGKGLIDGLELCLQKEVTETQQVINRRVPEAFFDRARSFSSSVLPLVNCLKKVDEISTSHFALMFDDAHDLNEYQVRALNSWISFRENQLFSFKVATARIDRPSHKTASGGTILDGHDFTLIDMEQPYQNKESAFGGLARQIVQRRLDKIDVKNDPESFFPMNPSMEHDLKVAREKVKEEALKKYGKGDSKQVTDYVYKYARAEYFRRRSARANRPPYSGFETLVHLSTGVVRNLLEPCYWMYDRVYSQKRLAGGNVTETINRIEPDTQTEIIIDRSKRKWEWLREGLEKSVEGCSHKQAIQVYQLLDNLAILFRERLLRHKSEPRAITFTISETDFDRMKDLEQLLRIARKAQILYTYSSSAKDSGRREVYYVPNRMLWPDRGLDPVGQHARVSIRASVLWAAAEKNRPIPFSQVEDNQKIPSLFDAQE